MSQQFEHNKLGGWLGFFYVTRWINFIALAITTIYIVVSFSGYGVDGAVFGMLICGIIACASYIGQSLFLKGNHKVGNAEEYLYRFVALNAVIMICLCILMNILIGSWVTIVLSYIVDTVIWGLYLKKSKRVQKYF